LYSEVDNGFLIQKKNFKMRLRTPRNETVCKRQGGDRRYFKFTELVISGGVEKL